MNCCQIYLACVLSSGGFAPIQVPHFKLEFGNRRSFREDRNDRRREC